MLYSFYKARSEIYTGDRQFFLKSTDVRVKKLLLKFCFLTYVEIKIF